MDTTKLIESLTGWIGQCVEQEGLTLHQAFDGYILCQIMSKL